MSGSHPIFVLQTSNKLVKYVRGQVLYKRLVVEKTMFRSLSFQNSFSSCLSVTGVDKDANDYKVKEATVPLWPLGSTIMQIVPYIYGIVFDAKDLFHLLHRHHGRRGSVIWERVWLPASSPSTRVSKDGCCPDTVFCTDFFLPTCANRVAVIFAHSHPPSSILITDLGHLLHLHHGMINVPFRVVIVL